MDFDACRFDFRLDSKNGLMPSKRRRTEKRDGQCYTLFKCKICGSLFDSRSALLDHKLIHNRPFFCSTCKLSFGRKSSLKTHLLQYHLQPQQQQQQQQQNSRMLTRDDCNQISHTASTGSLSSSYSSAGSSNIKSCATGTLVLKSLMNVGTDGAQLHHSIMKVQSVSQNDNTTKARSSFDMRLSAVSMGTDHRNEDESHGQSKSNDDANKTQSIKVIKPKPVISECNNDSSQLSLSSSSSSLLSPSRAVSQDIGKTNDMWPPLANESPSSGVLVYFNWPLYYGNESFSSDLSSFSTPPVTTSVTESELKSSQLSEANKSNEKTCTILQKLRRDERASDADLQTCSKELYEDLTRDVNHFEKGNVRGEDDGDFTQQVEELTIKASKKPVKKDLNAAVSLLWKTKLNPVCKEELVIKNDIVNTPQLPASPKCVVLDNDGGPLDLSLGLSRSKKSFEDFNAEARREKILNISPKAVCDYSITSINENISAIDCVDKNSATNLPEQIYSSKYRESQLSTVGESAFKKVAASCSPSVLCHICGQSYFAGDKHEHNQIKVIKTSLHTPDSSFPSYDNLKISNEKQRHFQCPVDGCFKILKTLTGLKNHQATHNNASLYLNTAAANDFGERNNFIARQGKNQCESKMLSYTLKENTNSNYSQIEYNFETKRQHCRKASSGQQPQTEQRHNLDKIKLNLDERECFDNKLVSVIDRQKLMKSLVQLTSNEKTESTVNTCLFTDSQQKYSMTSAGQTVPGQWSVSGDTGNMFIKSVASAENNQMDSAKVGNNLDNRKQGLLQDEMFFVKDEVNQYVSSNIANKKQDSLSETLSTSGGNLLPTDSTHLYSHGSSVCVFCGMILLSQAEIIQHIQQHHYNQQSLTPFTQPPCKVKSPPFAVDKNLSELQTNLCNDAHLDSNGLSDMPVWNGVNDLQSNDKYLTCDFPGCYKSFRELKHLKVHKMQHTDERPLKCLQCDYSCRQRNSMNWHMKSKHGKDKMVDADGRTIYV